MVEHTIARSMERRLSRVGTQKRQAVVRVQTVERAEEIVGFCRDHGIHCIVGLEPDKPEDVSDIDRALAAAQPARAAPKTGRNELCPCGSGKKYKKCCGVPQQRITS